MVFKTTAVEPKTFVNPKPISHTCGGRPEEKGRARRIRGEKNLFDCKYYYYLIFITIVRINQSTYRNRPDRPGDTRKILHDQYTIPSVFVCCRGRLYIVLEIDRPPSAYRTIMI